MPLYTTRSSPFLLAPDLAPGDQHIDITGDEATHGLKARRIRNGDAVTIINGHGLLGEGRVADVDIRANRLSIALDRLHNIDRLRPALTLAAALPKGDRLSTMLDMATQLGMDTFIPLDCEHSVVRYRPRMRERWQRIVESATKQSRRAWLPALEEAMDIKSLLADSAADDLLLFGDHHASGRTELGRTSSDCSRIIALVGPEGGFSPVEQSHLEAAHHVHATAIGQHVLRTETAAAALLTQANLVRQSLVDV